MSNHGSGSPGNTIPRSKQSSNAFFYNSLDPSIDMIRILVLEPSSDPTAELRCKLLHATFRQRPRYEALSYAWGREDDKRIILIGEKDFQVGRNLHDALVHLRSNDAEQSIWVDAVCINQADIAERSQQVRIMHHIYRRAQTVLVWLGTSDFTKEVWDMTFNLVDHKKDYDKDSSEALISAMCNQDYWSRVWIVQEIGKARKIRIHYGIGMVDWNAFIDRVQRINVDDCVPLNLANQLSEKFGDGHKLENLLWRHKKALCKEPRDKIYGFTGLAVDCHDQLPIDYKKSLFEVWKDTILFKNSDRKANQFDILQFGRLVKFLLGGPEIATEEDFKKEMELSNYYSSSMKLKVPVLLRGMIVHLGPTYDEFFSNLRRADEWEATIYSTIDERFMPSTRVENDFFIELLNELDYGDLKRIYKFDSYMSISYSEYEQEEYRFFSTIEGSIPDRPQLEEWSTDIVEESSISSAGSSTTSPQLFLLKTWESQDSFPASWMGLAPMAAREGDFICHLYQTDLAVVVRRTLGSCDSVTHKMIGTAVVAKDHKTAQATKDEKAGETPKFAVPYYKQEQEESQVVPLYMGLRLAYELSI